jgi:hypothetical protein
MKMLSVTTLLALVLSSSVAETSNAQTATIRVPQCLQIIAGKKYFSPCTGVVPVDTANGNALSWSELLNNTDYPNGQAATKSTAVQNNDGTKIVSDATANSLFKSGQSVGNTFFGARLQDANGVALGTSANPVFVSGGTGGGGGGSTITATAGTSNATAVPVQSVTGGSLALDATTNALFKAGQSIGNTTFGATQSGTWNVGTVTSITNPVAVTGSFYQATQPVSAASLPLPTGAATAAKQDATLAAIGTPLQAGGTIGAVTSITNPVAVTGSFYQTTQPVSAAALPLPTGAATAAKQDSLLTALGSPVQAGSTISNVIQATATDRGAVIGTTAVTLMAANPTRKSFSLQNQSATASCYINGTTTATADYHSLLVGPGGYFEPDHHVGTGAISVVCSAAATSVYAREW